MAAYVQETRSLIADRVVVMVSSIFISISNVAIVGMLLAALTFANGMTVNIPFVATFDGFRDAGGSPAVTVNGSWVAAGIVVLILALPLWIVALRYRREAA